MLPLDLEPDQDGMARDERALRRDETAGSRDLAADARDRAASRRDEVLLANDASHDPTIRALVQANGVVRGQAAADRAGAASDRRGAAADRAQAGADSGQARVELQHAQLDGLTGVYNRELGWLTIQHEIDRARRSSEPFVLAFVDVDGLKALNDDAGHAAGDALLKAVVGVLRSNLRSYDPVVRVGGDEFVCGFTNTELEAARRRVRHVQTGVAATRAVVERRSVTGSVTVGLASLQPHDSLEELVARADADMYSHKQVGRSVA
jgi:diguanylate cyclase (GGDEF)-like protein